MTTNVEQGDDPLAALLGPRTEGYIDFPLPDDHDRQVGAVVDEVARANDAVFSAVRSHLTIDHAYILQAYARRMAIYAVRTHSVPPLKQALVALALAQPASDFRELIVEFTIIDHSAQLVGTTLDDLVQTLPTIVDIRPRERLASYLRRTPQNRTLEAMQLRAVGEGSQFTYASTQPQMTKEQVEALFAGRGESSSAG